MDTAGKPSWSTVGESTRSEIANGMLFVDWTQMCVFTREGLGLGFGGSGLGWPRRKGIRLRPLDIVRAPSSITPPSRRVLASPRQLAQAGLGRGTGAGIPPAAWSS